MKTQTKISAIVAHLFLLMTGLPLVRAAENKLAISFELTGGADAADAIVLSRNLNWWAPRWFSRQRP
jgi:hypothetical protein